MFSSDDENLIGAKGITLDQVNEQIETFKKGIDPITLQAPAVVGDGIMKVTDEEVDKFISIYESFDGSVSKFVPASGAASRMFKHLFEFAENYDGSDAQYQEMVESKGKVWDFFKQLEDFAFYPQLENAFQERNGHSLKEAHLKRKYREILNAFLMEEGMNYGKLPKGLLKFHKYESENRISAHEQLVEGVAYAAKNDQLNIHFTVSPEHLDLFKQNLSELQQHFENTDIHASYSIQKSSTDTIAVDEQNKPFRNENGGLLFRPAGHGALLENLNELDQEIIFIKNIDNVVPDRLKEETIRFKKLIAGVLIHHQHQIFELLKLNDAGKDITIDGTELLRTLGFKGDLTKEEVIQKLNRPIRVCGMVKNEGEPGGGPFWVSQNGYSSLQIVEGAQIDQSNSAQTEILGQSTHFNPVDIVCGVYNYKKEKFDLLNYRDMDTGFITEKSSGGKKLKAMELPGLWNGSMADWNTIFVEVPLITFNPVKTINDLLRPEHQ